MVITSFALLVAGWIQGLSPQPVWYNAVLLGAAVTVACAFVTSRYAAWQDRKSRREALLASYLGEVSVIRKELRRYLEGTASSIEEEEELPEINNLTQPAMPRKVFEETVGILGEIGDAKLVELIANLYAQIEHAEENTRRLVESATPVPENHRTGHFKQHLALLGDSTITLYVIKELLLHNPRAQATDLVKGRFRDEEDMRDLKLVDELGTLLQ
jgi:hypothetical protein